MDKETLHASFESIKRKISEACIRSGREASVVKLLAVSKKQPLEKLIYYQEIAQEAGLEILFGENYVQEWEEKRIGLKGDYHSHLIGPLQRNKVRKAISIFDVIESVHSIELARELQKEAKRIGKVQRIFFQVNISDDPAKSGFEPELLLQALQGEIETMENLKIEGLMTITKFYPVAEEVREDYRRFYELYLKAKEIEPECQEISMGMSSDYEVAIEEGATIIRVGSALFGQRA